MTHITIPLDTFTAFIQVCRARIKNIMDLGDRVYAAERIMKKREKRVSERTGCHQMAPPHGICLSMRRCRFPPHLTDDSFSFPPIPTILLPLPYRFLSYTMLSIYLVKHERSDFELSFIIRKFGTGMLLLEIHPRKNDSVCYAKKCVDAFSPRAGDDD